MRVLLNLLVEMDVHDTVIKSHVLTGYNKKACHCVVSKLVKKETVEGVDIRDSADFNLCDGSRKKLQKDIGKLGDWLDGKPTQL